MKKKTTGLKKIAAVMGCMLLMAGCGSSNNTKVQMSGDTSAAAGEMAYEESAAYASDDIYMLDSGAAVAGELKEAEEGGSSGVQVQDVSRKLIRNVNLNVETEEFDVLMQTITEKTGSFGGYVESSYTYNGSYYYGNNNRNASLTLRIPAERLDEFLSLVAENSNVISRDESVTDVTLKYVDMKSHKEALETEQKRLLELLEQAENVEDIITIESRLSEVRYQIESMESQLRTMDNQVSYSTIYLYIDEVRKLTPVKELTTWEKITTGFAESLNDVGHGIGNFFIILVIDIPYLILWAVIILIVLLAVKLMIKLLKKRRAVRQDKERKYQEEEQKKQQALTEGTVEQKEEK